ncbi:hypothetical protein N7519_003624 [Penicillium mononematosum]|uniref:uncharacterized protein n=1 Tax=Penicillium mononematosum TaxID=268346 RepID=UPI0025481BB3|nr:uncharacterized protein N7519_003624 [Penicillium mononematosum]KAJ6188716.1 hypothetical protein N7519_003624 [Penicillium mononematosum]
MSSQRQASSASQPFQEPNPTRRPLTHTIPPLSAETTILPGTNGSARIGFADGTQAIVGVKAEVEKTVLAADTLDSRSLAQHGDALNREGEEGSAAVSGQGEWVQMSIEIPGFRDDDALPVFLSEMMRESLVGSVAGGDVDGAKEMAGGLKGRLVINKRWHWRLSCSSPNLSHTPSPLLSLTTHLALLSTKLPKLKSTGEEDPFFDDDWAAAEYLYPRSNTSKSSLSAAPSYPVRPPVTLLVIAVGENVIFDPNREEIAVADAVLAISPGIPNSENVNMLGATAAPGEESGGQEEVEGVWRPRRGGVKRGVIARMVKTVLGKGGVGEEVLEGLEGVEVQ